MITDLAHVPYASTLAKKIMDSLMTREICTKMQWNILSKDSRPAMGVTDAEGRFTLGTNKPGDGAVAGSHKVAVTWVGPPSTNPNEGMTEFTSPPPPKVKLDPKYSDPETSGLVLEVPESGSAELKVELP